MLNSGDTVWNCREKVGLITLHGNLYADAAEFGITRTAKFFAHSFNYFFRLTLIHMRENIASLVSLSSFFLIF